MADTHGEKGEDAPPPARSALVLGGSRGIGAAIVRALCADGVRVRFTWVADGDAAARVAAETGALAVRADSADRAALLAAIQAAGPLDLLVVNAGIFVGGDPAIIPPEAIDRLIDVNIRAPYFAIAEAGKTMRDGGRMIVIGSSNGDRIAVPGAAAYAMSKAAMQGLVRGFARDFGPRGITVNCIQPGPVDTDANPADGPAADGVRRALAIRRYARPQEVADLVRYLASDSAGMVTGALLTIDGGLSI